MSSKDALHLPGAFSLADAPRLPLTGEQHPLNREFARWMSWANGLALVFGVLAFALWMLSGKLKKEAPVMREVHIVRYTELGVPPSIARSATAVPQINIAQAVAPPSIGVPEPVPAVEAQTTTIATQTEISEAVPAVSATGLGIGTGDSLVVEGPPAAVDEHPAPEDFVPVDVEPVRLRIDAPVYPDVAMQAGVEGTVTVRALVGRNGKVIKAQVIEGPEALHDAAIACARTAVFRPAMTQNEPVEVWVAMPITFKLRAQ